MEMITRMIRISKKLALAASLTAIVVGLGTGIAFAQGDTDDSIIPVNTAFTANSTGIVFKIIVNGISITVTCKTSSISGTTPPSGLGPMNISVSFSNCTVSAGGSATITTNNTNGPWLLTFLDSTATNEETQTEPNTGDKMQITIPKAGATFTSTAFPGCTITAAPAGPANVIGSYDDMSTLSFNNAPITVSGAGCTVTSATVTGSYKFTPGLQDVS
jgi:hypothetical protein